MGTRFATTGPVGPQLGPDDAANLRTQFAALRADVAAAAAALGGDGILSAPGLTIGTSAPTKMKFVTFTLVINGVQESVTGAEVDFTATTDDIADGSAVFYTIACAAGGTVSITIGTPAVGTAGGAKAAVPTGEGLMGYILLAASGAIFNATTDDLSETWITDTYADAVLIPAEIIAAVTAADLTV